MNQYEILRGDCITQMRAMPDNSVDSIVTDPPYELTGARPGGRSPATEGKVMKGFMGMAWDGSGIAFSVDMWREALRVLKPGGHLLAFSGSRTYHRMTCAIEDAGFEVRDQIFWCYGSGFPKSNNLDNQRGKLICGCTTDAVPYTHERTQQKTERDLHDLLGTDVSTAVDPSEGRGQILQPGLPEQSAPTHRGAGSAGKHEGSEQPGLEGRGDDVQAEGQLQGHSVHSGAGAVAADGAQGRLHNGTPGSDGPVVRLPADAHGSGAPRRPRSNKQPPQQPGTVADEQRAQAGGAWPICGGCKLPVVPRGLGTALKPAHEPICVARKPLVGTVAANVLQHGTGAMNIDGCRVATGTDDLAAMQGRSGKSTENNTFGAGMGGSRNGTWQPEALGRWPANLIHDGSDEVVSLFPAQAGAAAPVRGTEASAASTGNVTGERSRVPGAFHADSGSAARFFYCAKASKADRGPGNTHPTVKPQALMRYLVRLVTLPGGHVLDPFMGSGSTVVAALSEGMRATGIELLDEHAAIAEARIDRERYGDLL